MFATVKLLKDNGTITFDDLSVAMTRIQEHATLDTFWDADLSAEQTPILTDVSADEVAPSE